jgi:hypothetical protein
VRITNGPIKVKKDAVRIVIYKPKDPSVIL